MLHYFFPSRYLLIFCIWTNLCLADDYKAKKALVAPIIDGLDTDVCWNAATWSAIDQVWDPKNASAGTASDFTGHYKAVWTPEKLYVLMRVTDDKLTFWNEGKDPLINYWQTDCPEIFIDEDRSKGNHQCNFNAFAYHISMIYDVVDSDNSCNAKLFKDVLTGARTKVGDTYFWEFAINVYTDKYVLGAQNNPKATLAEGKTMGFSIAYNDSDDKWERERMYGSQVINLADKNVSYITADYFGSMELVAADVTSIENEASLEGIAIFPNPAQHSFTIVGSLYSSVSASLSNSLGTTVWSQNELPVGNPIDISQLPKGMYQLTIRSDKKTLTRKLMVE